MIKPLPLNFHTATVFR